MQIIFREMSYAQIIGYHESSNCRRIMTNLTFWVGTPSIRSRLPNSTIENQI